MEGEYTTFPKEVIEEIHQRVYSSGNIRSAVTVHILFSLNLKSEEVEFWIFKNLNMESDFSTIKVYKIKTNTTQALSTSQELYDELKEYRVFNIKGFIWKRVKQ